MTDKLFDSFISDKLSNHKSPVPEGLWEKIMPEEKRKPKAIWWWFTAVAIIIALATAGGYSYKTYWGVNKPNTIASDKYSETHKAPHQPSNSNSLFEKNENIDSIKNIDNKQVINIDENNKTNNKLSASISANEANSNTKANSISLNSSSFGESIFKNKFEKINKIKVDNQINTNNISFKNRIDKKLQLQKNWSKQKNLVADNAKWNDDNENLTTALRSFGNKYQTNNLVDITDLNANCNKTSLVKFEEKLLKDPLPKFSFKTDDCPSAKGNFREDFYVEGYASPDFARKNVSANNANSTTYISKKDSSENMQLGFTVGARFVKSLTNNLLIKAGLQYSHLSEKTVWRTENERKQTIVITTHTIPRAGGLPDTTISDTTVSFQIGYRTRTTVTHYKNLELPIILSYEFGSTESMWKIAVNAGAIVNVTSWYDGKTFDSNYDLVNAGSKANNGFYQHKIGVSLYTGVSILRKINDKVDVFIEPYYRFGILNSVDSKAGFAQRFNIGGVQFGARIKLNNSKHF